MRRRIGSVLLSIVLSASMITPAYAAETVDSGYVTETESQEVTETVSEAAESVVATTEVVTESIEPESEEVVVEEAISESETETANEEFELLEAEVSSSSGSVSTGMNNDEMFEGYVNKVFGIDDELELEGTILGDKLTGSEKILYEYLETEIQKVANGTRADSVFAIDIATLGIKTEWTAEELGYSQLDGSNLSDAARKVLDDCVDNNAVVSALLGDYPYELYWFDKTIGWAYTLSGMCPYEDKIILSPDSEYAITFWVSSDYSLSGAIKTSYIDTAKTSKPKTAAANARSVVTQYASYDDLDKITAYKDYICNQVSYNHDAVDYDFAYGDPWQMIYVFDNDSSTDVVCEGYSKAYQYLCDNSQFSDDSIHSIIATGLMAEGTSQGPHMWNIMHMEDGKNYLVDVTNCDSGTAGAPSQLFMVGAKSGNVEDGYRFYTTSGYINYQYKYLAHYRDGYGNEWDDWDFGYLPYYSTEELTISSTNYVKPAGKMDPTCTPPSVTATFGQKLSDISLSNPAGNTPGTWTWNSPDTLVGKPGEAHEYEATFTPSDTTKYNVKKNIKVSVTVNFLTASPVLKYNDSTVKRPGLPSLLAI